MIFLCLSKKVKEALLITGIIPNRSFLGPNRYKIHDYKIYNPFAEAVAQVCSVKKAFLEIWQNSQENTCARVFFSIKLQARGMQRYLKRDSGRGAFL